MRRVFGLYLLVAAVTAPRIVAWISDAPMPPIDSLPPPITATTKDAPLTRITPSDYVRNPLLFLSTAPRDSLQLLPGIGPVLAERIASTRSGRRLFTRWDDLLAVKGIGPKTLDRLRQLSEESR